MKLKSFWTGFATCYLLTAVLFAAGITRAMPDLNWRGAAYYGIVWPAWPLSVLLHAPVMPIPKWAFVEGERRTQ